MTRPVCLLILILPVAALASTPPSTPTPRPTRPAPILGKTDKVVAGPRSLADAAKERPKKGGTVSQMDSSVDQYEYVYEPGTPERGPAPKQRGVTFTIPAPAPNGPTHGVPQVGMSIEDHRAAQAAAAATPAPPPSTKKKK